MVGAASCFITPDLYLSCTWSWIPTSARASGAEGRAEEGRDGGVRCFLPLPVLPDGRRGGCHGSLRGSVFAALGFFVYSIVSSTAHSAGKRKA